MIDSFEQSAAKTPDALFFRFEEADGTSISVTYRQARDRYWALVRAIEDAGNPEPGTPVACDMENCPEFVYLLMACEATQLTLVALNHRLSDEEKADRLQSAFPAEPSIPVITAAQVAEAIAEEQQAARADDLLTEEPAAASSADTAAAIVMFTSGTTGQPKAAHLKFAQLEGSAEVYNHTCLCDGTTRWQVALPLYHVGGLQMVIRSILNGTSFILYRHFKAAQILADAERFGATHLSVVDKMLSDLVAAATDPALDLSQTATRCATLRAYRCILLGGAAPNPRTIEAALAQEAPVYSSYGMTETCSLVAACPITRQAGQALMLLPGYEACIADPDETGSGQLGVRGPGIFDGYLNGRASFTPDGFFLTGDRARMKDGRLYLSERLQDMFVSGGENIYPEEIRKKILGIPDVTDAYVFGAEDAAWGRRPVAFVGMAAASVLPETAAQLAGEVKMSLDLRLSKLNLPDRLYVVDSLPRTGIGKVDARVLRARDATALDIREVRVHRIRQPFVKPVRTARELLRGRESLLVEVIDAKGRIGTGEDTAFASDWYLPETIPSDLAFLEKQAIPCLLSHSYLQPDAVFGSFAQLPRADEHLMAVSALETALWDLCGTITHRTIAEMIGARHVWDVRGREFTLSPGYAPGGVVIGLMSIAQTVATATAAYKAGYLRIKLKIRPGDDLHRVAAVREALPDAILMLDANQSYTDNQLPQLRELDQFRCAGIEEPLDPRYTPKDGLQDLFSRLANLQQALSTPVFLDESIVTPADAQRALTFPDLRGYVMKIGKWGGVLPAVDFYWQARHHGATVWMGGMFDTGISKRLHAAFTMLPGVTLPGDVNEAQRYFAHDITAPPLVMEDGCVLVNPPEAPYGLGCRIDYDALENVLVETRTYRRGCLPAIRRVAER